MHPRLNRGLWARLRKGVFQRDGWRCVQCGSPGPTLECDHIVPIYRDGELYDPANLQTLCRPCHILKTTRENSRKLTREEILARIGVFMVRF